MSGRRRLLVVPLLVFGVLAAPASAHAHPLGNFTINTSASLVLRADEVVVDYAVDMAEIPTFQERRTIDADGDGSLSSAETAAYRGDACADLRGRTAPGRRRNPCSSGGALLGPFSPRRSGRTADASTRLQLPGRPWLPARRTTLMFEDANYPDRLGWREVTAAGDGATIVRSDVPSRKSQSSTQVLSQERSAFERSLRDHRVRAGRRSALPRCVRGWDLNAGERRAPRRPRLSAGSLGRTRRAHDRGGDRRRRRPRARSRPRQVADRGVPRRERRHAPAGGSGRRRPSR